MSNTLLDRLKKLQDEKRALLKYIENLENGSEERFTYIPGYDRGNTKRDLKQIDAIKYTMDLARSGLSIVEKVLKEMRRIIEYKIDLNNPIYNTQLDLLKGELSCISRLFVYDKVEVFNSGGWEWDVGNTTYNWDYNLDSSISSIDYTANGIGKIDKITANIARSYFEIDAILLNVNINSSAILDIDETNRTEVVDTNIHLRLKALTREINDIIKCLLEETV